MMKKLITFFAAVALAATLLPGTSQAAGRHHDRHVRAAHPAYAGYAAAPGYSAAVVAPHPLLYPLVGAGIGAIIGAAVCPPCSIAGSALTAGGGALVGAGIGAVSGSLIAVAATHAQPHYY